MYIEKDNETIVGSGRTADGGFGLKDLAFVGRSNVGKSSLVNILLGGNYAQTSKTPGKTKNLTFYETMLGGARIVDCPGYRFGNACHQEKESWRKFMENYMRDAIHCIKLSC